MLDGVPGHTPTIKRATYATMEAAVEHIHAMSLDTPTARTCPSSLTIWAGDPVAKRLKMSSSREVRRTVNRIANMLLNGDIDPKTANAILYACNVSLGAIRTDEQEKKLAELEMLVKQVTEK